MATQINLDFKIQKLYFKIQNLYFKIQYPRSLLKENSNAYRDNRRIILFEKLHDCVQIFGSDLQCFNAAFSSVDFGFDVQRVANECRHVQTHISRQQSE